VKAPTEMCGMRTAAVTASWDLLFGIRAVGSRVVPVHFTHLGW
jgi:hypothetical protein